MDDELKGTAKLPPRHNEATHRPGKAARDRVLALARITLGGGFVLLTVWVSVAYGGVHVVPTTSKITTTSPAQTSTQSGSGGVKGGAVEPPPTTPALPPIYTKTGTAPLVFQAWALPASLTLPAGNYFILARVTIQTPFLSELGATCALDAGYSAQANNANPVDTISGEEMTAVWTLVGVVHFKEPGYALVECTQGAALNSTATAILTAIPGSSIIRQ